MSSLITEPRRRRLSAVSNSRTRSSASSRISSSESRMTRNAPDALHRVAGEQLADEQAGRAFDRDQPHLAALAGLRQPHEAFDAVRHADQRIHRPAVLGAGKLQGDREAEIGNERERMRRIDGERRQQRKDVREEIIFEPGLLGLGDVGAVDQHDAGAAPARRAARATAPAGPPPAARPPRRCARAARPGVNPSGLCVAIPARTCARRPATRTMKNSSRLFGRDRQEPQPLEQRMLAIGGFFEDAAIEIEPGQLAIDEALRACGERRRRVPFSRFRQPLRRVQPKRPVVIDRDRRRLAAIGHGCALCLELHTFILCNDSTTHHSTAIRRRGGGAVKAPRRCDQLS